MEDYKRFHYTTVFEMDGGIEVHDEIDSDEVVLDFRTFDPEADDIVAAYVIVNDWDEDYQMDWEEWLETDFVKKEKLRRLMESL